jgi:hypothetical protein
MRIIKSLILKVFLLILASCHTDTDTLKLKQDNIEPVKARNYHYSWDMLEPTEYIFPGSHIFSAKLAINNSRVFLACLVGPGGATGYDAKLFSYDIKRKVFTQKTIGVLTGMGDTLETKINKIEATNDGVWSLVTQQDRYEPRSNQLIIKHDNDLTKSLASIEIQYSSLDIKIFEKNKEILLVSGSIKPRSEDLITLIENPATKRRKITSLISKNNPTSVAIYAYNFLPDPNSGDHFFFIEYLSLQYYIIYRASLIKPEEKEKIYFTSYHDKKIKKLSAAIHNNKLIIASTMLDPDNNKEKYKLFMCDIRNDQNQLGCFNGEEKADLISAVNKMVSFKDHLYLATSKGLYQYDGDNLFLFNKNKAKNKPQNTSKNNYDMENDVVVDKVFDIAIQEPDTLWLAADKGIARLRITTD